MKPCHLPIGAEVREHPDPHDRGLTLLSSVCLASGAPIETSFILITPAKRGVYG
jgi:hypothetical protein